MARMGYGRRAMIGPDDSIAMQENINSVRKDAEQGSRQAKSCDEVHVVRTADGGDFCGCEMSTEEREVLCARLLFIVGLQTLPRRTHDHR